MTCVGRLDEAYCFDFSVPLFNDMSRSRRELLYFETYNVSCFPTYNSHMKKSYTSKPVTQAVLQREIVV